jgi:hypothetical protein
MTNENRALVDAFFADHPDADQALKVIQREDGASGPGEKVD